MDENTELPKKNHTIPYIIAGCVSVIVLILILYASLGSKKDQQVREPLNTEQLSKQPPKQPPKQLSKQPTKKLKVHLDQKELSAIEESLNERIEAKGLGTCMFNAVCLPPFWHTRENVLDIYIMNRLYDVWNFVVVVTLPLCSILALGKCLCIGIALSNLNPNPSKIISEGKQKLAVGLRIVCFLILFEVLVYILINLVLNKYPIYHPAYSTYKKPSDPTTKEYTAEDLTQAQKQQEELEQQMSEDTKEKSDAEQASPSPYMQSSLEELEKELQSKEKEYQNAKSEEKEEISEQINQLKMGICYKKAEEKYNNTSEYLTIARNKVKLLKRYVSLQEQSLTQTLAA